MTLKLQRDIFIYINFTMIISSPSSSWPCRRTVSCLCLFPKPFHFSPQTPVTPWDRTQLAGIMKAGVHMCKSCSDRTYLRITIFFFMGQGFPFSVVISFFLSSTASFNFSSSSGVRDPKTPTGWLSFDSESEFDSDSELRGRNERPQMGTLLLYICLI